MSKSPTTGSFVIVSRFDEIQPVEDAILHACAEYGFDESARFAIKLAMEEALTNAIKHGNAMDPNKNVHVKYQVDPEQLELSVRDEGPGFHPAHVPDPTHIDNLEKPSGRGIMLMRAYMTDVWYDQAGTTVTMIKHRDCQLPNLAGPPHH